MAHNAYSLEPGKDVAIDRNKHIQENQSPGGKETGHLMVFVLNTI